RPHDPVRRPRRRARCTTPPRGPHMIPLRLDELPPLGKLDAHAEEITGVQVDSRRIRPGDLFVALGRGIDFRADALTRGAAATLVPEKPFEALAAIGAAVRERSNARVVGITGSTGKTSTKDILATLCAPSARTVAAEASYNNEVGVPLTLCRLEPGTEICVLELAMRGFGQIAELCAIARPEIGVITNVGPAHLALVGSPGGGRLINDAYNANPVSMRAALAYLAQRAGGRRRVAILGDMAELGPGAPAFHREIGVAVAEQGVQTLVAVGELARGYLDGAAGVPVTRWCADATAAVAIAEEVVEPGDCVLVKASRALGLELGAEGLAS